MPIILIPIVLILLYMAERRIFNRYWQKGLSAELKFGSEAVTEGDEAALTEVITNRNFIPLHILQVNFQTDIGLFFKDTTNASVTDRVNVIDVFSLRFYEKITRNLVMDCKKRGFYSILQTSLVASDLFSSDIHYADRKQRTSMYVYPRLMEMEKIEIPFQQLMGEVQSQRFIYEDNFTFRGIRDYAPTDQMSDINWKASARTGAMKVNLHDYTSSPEVVLVLNVEEPGILFETELIEDCIRIARSLSAKFIESNTPVSLLTNGKDKVTGEVIRLESGASMDHALNFCRALARIDLTKGVADIETLIKEELKGAGSRQLVYCVISTSRRDGIVHAASDICDEKGKLMWLCPLTKSMDQRAPLEGRIEFVRIIHDSYL
ncbi:DUF58 domain-containing protein [Butyrivibrio sp. VCB2006]|uniref:DUF58 domain-containing protein n=1 Tax=Butyrivibrio sp. VCB2006 TaxID=1280679 RepID=UPI00041C9D9C|nr:DUF58 domain-containing protein [Butyrivibrio sp. VCB2006]